MIINCAFESVDMGDEFILVPVGDSASNVQGVIKLNSSGKEIADLLFAGLNEKAVVERLSVKYDNDVGEIGKFVAQTLTALEEAGAISR